jgi:hypothetical protein
VNPRVVRGAILVEFSRWLDAYPRQFYPVYDYWRTSPSFFLIRVGMLLVIMTATYAWCRWGAGQWGFSPLIEMGKCSLLVYWVHVELAYGGLTYPIHSALTVGAALMACAAFTAAKPTAGKVVVPIKLAARTHSRGPRRLAFRELALSDLLYAPKGTRVSGIHV